VQQIRFRPGSALDPAGGSLKSSPDPLGGLRGPTSKVKGRGVERKGKEGRGRGGKRRGREEKDRSLSRKFVDPPMILVPIESSYTTSY